VPFARDTPLSAERRQIELSSIRGGFIAKTCSTLDKIVAASLAAAVRRAIRIVWVDAVNLSENVVQGRTVESDHWATKSSDTIPMDSLCGCVANIYVALDRVIAVIVAAAICSSVRIVGIHAVDLAQYLVLAGSFEVDHGAARGKNAIPVSSGIRSVAGLHALVCCAWNLAARSDGAKDSTYPASHGFNLLWTKNLGGLLDRCRGRVSDDVDWRALSANGLIVEVVESTGQALVEYSVGSESEAVVSAHRPASGIDLEDQSVNKNIRID